MSGALSTSADGVRGAAGVQVDGVTPVPAAFTLLGDDAAPGCVGDECALPTPAPPSDH